MTCCSPHRIFIRETIFPPISEPLTKEQLRALMEITADRDDIFDPHCANCGIALCNHQKRVGGGLLSCTLERGHDGPHDNMCSRVRKPWTDKAGAYVSDLAAYNRLAAPMRPAARESFFVRWERVIKAG